MKHFIYLLSVVFFLTSCKNKNDLKFNENTKFNASLGNITDFKTINFPSKDGLSITADLYLIKEPKDIILLCHQAGFSRGEYIETAKRLNKMGYSCLAIDQRSGKGVNGVVNQTAELAIKKGVESSSYLDAKPDIEAAIDYAYKMNNSKAVIIVGSSYSASLSLLLATSSDKIKAVAAFSPGEYLKGVSVSKAIVSLDKPIFVTSSKKEINEVVGLLDRIVVKNITHFKPKTASIHGSRGLWKSTESNGNCWSSFEGWLKSLK